MPKSDYRDVDGILLLDKPAGLSSNRALQRVRHLFRARKAGHTGSLDPLATGLLPVCFGEATKIAGYLLGARKAYVAQVRLGTNTDTDDADGQIIRTRPVPVLAEPDIENALTGLRGHIRQVPPVYSALKRDGVPLYKRARRGENVRAESREVEIFRLETEAIEGEQLRLHVECSSGTYVRSLARDLGERLGCGAHLTGLRRLWVEPFFEPVMFTLEYLENRASKASPESLDALLLPLERGLSALPAIRFDGQQSLRLRRGQRFHQAGLEPGRIYRALDERDCLVALIEISDQGLIRIRRGFAEDSPQS